MAYVHLREVIDSGLNEPSSQLVGYSDSNGISDNLLFLENYLGDVKTNKAWWDLLFPDMEYPLDEHNTAPRLLSRSYPRMLADDGGFRHGSFIRALQSRLREQFSAEGRERKHDLL